MRILVVCYEHPPVGGGGGRIAAQIAQSLVLRGHQVSYLTGNVDSPHHLPARSQDEGVEVIRVASPRKLPDTCTVAEMGGYVLAGLFAGWREIRSFRPDVLHVHFAVPSGALAWMLSKITGVPYVLTAHLGDVPGGVPAQTDHLFRWIKPLTVPIWRGAAAITAVSRFVADLAHTAYGMQPHIIPNGLRFAHAPLAVALTPPRLLFVGRLSVQKNLLLALRALVLLRDMDWTFQVIGDGPLRAEAETFVHANGLSQRVEFLGWMDGEQLRKKRRGASLLLMPSLSEGLPMAAVEALVDGLAIVGTRIPGLADVVEAGVNGALAEPTPEGFAHAVREILSHPSRLQSFRQQSLEKAQHFHLEGIVTRYENILQGACHHSHSPPD